MHRLLLFSLFLVAPFALLLNTYSAANEKEFSSDTGYTVYYLSDHKVYRTPLFGTGEPQLVDIAQESSSKGIVQITGLSCGPGHALILQVTRISTAKAPSSGSDWPATITLQKYDSRAKTVSDLSLPSTWVRSPVLSPDGQKLAVADRKALLIKDFKRGDTDRYNPFADRSGPFFFGPTSWSPDGKTLALTAGAIGSERPKIYFFEPDKTALTQWPRPGIDAYFSPDGKRVAYQSDDGKELLIADRSGNTLQSLGSSSVRRLDGWVGNDKLLLTMYSSTRLNPYSNRIGIADLKEKKIHIMPIKTQGEIQGMCVQSDYRGR